MMMQQPQPEDFVLATGETHPVREFVEKSFAVLGVTIKCVTVVLCLDLGLYFTSRWRGSGVDEEGYNAQTGTTVVRVDPQYFRPAEVEYVHLYCGVSFD